MNAKKGYFAEKFQRHFFACFVTSCGKNIKDRGDVGDHDARVVEGVWKFLFRPSIFSIGMLL